MLEQMVFYAQTGRCRWRVLLDHFGESIDADGCGRCDNCVRVAATRESKTMAGEATASTAADVHEARSEPPRPGFAPGDEVSVPRYGRGVVEAVDAVGITVLFAGDRRRMFLAAFIRPAAGRRRDPATSLGSGLRQRV